MKEISLRTEKQFQVLDITNKIEEYASRVGGEAVLAFVPHTTAAITIQERDTDLWEDLIETYKKIVPVRGNYKHNAKYSKMDGEQNAHAHILSSLINPFVILPVEKEQLTLGTWQRILFIELDGGRTRKVKLKSFKSLEKFTKNQETLSRVISKLSTIIKAILESQVVECAHCGCKIYEGAYREEIKGKEMTFCCENCARAYKELGPFEDEED